MAARFPLTFQQQWLWNLLQQHDDWKSVIAGGFRLKGTLSIAALQSSLEEVIRRHASLRTRVVTVDGVTMQQIDEPRTFRLDCVQIAGASGVEVRASARRLFAQLSEAPLDPAADPLLRISLLRLGEHEHWLLLAVHRLIGECFTADQLSPQIWSLYADFSQGRPSSLSTSQAQYHDYALSQREAHADWAKRHEPYWNGRLATARSLQWPTDDCASGTPRGVLGRMNTRFEEELSAGLRDLARRERALLATVMLAVYGATLWRYCNQRDFVVPFFVAGRQSEHKSVIGYFSHVLYLRMDLTGLDTYRDLLGYVGKEFFRALSHQDFGRMALQEPRLLEGNFFQWITWHLEDAPALSVPSAPEAPDLTVERVSVADFAEDLTAIPPGMVAVELTCFDTSKGIYASGVYRADLFTPATMEHFMAELRWVAKQFIRDPDKPMAG